MKSALIGGGVFGTASALPYLEMINMVCCALVIGAGVLATYLYFKDMEPTTGHLGQGASVGWLAGIVCALANTIVSAIVTAAGFSPDVSPEMLEGFGELPTWLSDYLNMLASPGVNALKIGLTLLVSLILCSIFSTIGGLVGAAMFAKKAEKTE